VWRFLVSLNNLPPGLESSTSSIVFCNSGTPSGRRPEQLMWFAARADFAVITLMGAIQEMGGTPPNPSAYAGGNPLRRRA
jgi:hypothetical protein